MSDLDLHAELTNYQRTFLALGEALIAAAGKLGTYANHRRDVVGTLERELTQREMAIDLLGLDVALLCAVGLLAGKTGQTPREIIDHYWKAAPTDDDWRTLLATSRDRRQGDTT